MFLDHWLAAILIPLAFWVLLNGLDDLVLDFVVGGDWLLARIFPSRRKHIPTDQELDAVPQRRMAIFVALWKEHRVIQSMVETNVFHQNYKNFDFFIGVYPNDGPTLAAVREVKRRFFNVHLSVTPHRGGTSKADNLNWIYQRMLLFEEENGVRFEMILTHDAEDFVHPEAMRWINYYAQWHDMVQIPVLALPTPWTHLTHGVYCDEFALFQFKDMRARQIMGGFIPSNGVGTGFTRNALERLAAAYSNRIFEPDCLTEDYENGFRVHKLGLPQVFIPIRKYRGSFLATREYFPQIWRKAIRQRSRWVTGITLQSWELHGLRETLQYSYWFWRDRKALIGNLLTPFANLLFLAGAATAAWSGIRHAPWALAHDSRLLRMLPLYITTLSIQAFHVSIRVWCSAAVYGWKFAMGVPLRVLWGNLINFLCTVFAIWNYSNCRIHGRPLRWAKTEHAYPNRNALMGGHKPLGEILVGAGYLAPEEFAAAMATKPKGLRTGEHLIALGKISEEDLYQALALQQNLPLGKPEPALVSESVTRSFPAELARKWQVLPFRIAAGRLYVAGTDPTSEKMAAEIQQFSTLEIRFHLVTPTEYEELARQYLPE